MTSCRTCTGRARIRSIRRAARSEACESGTGNYEIGVMIKDGPRKGEFSVAVLNPDGTHTLKTYFVRGQNPEQYFIGQFPVLREVVP